MPSYVIVQSGFEIGETIAATLCAPGVAGLPVRVCLVSEQVLFVDDVLRGIIWSEGGSGTTTFLVDGGTKSIRNRERRAALARASELLKQLTSSLMPLAAESAEPRLQLLFDWIARERERAITAPRSIGADGARDDHAR